MGMLPLELLGVPRVNETIESDLEALRAGASAERSTVRFDLDMEIGTGGQVASARRHQQRLHAADDGPTERTPPV